MNIIGKWKLKGLNIPSEKGLELFTVDNYPEEYADVFNENKDMILEFLEDGTLNTIVEAVEPYISMAAEEGLESRADGYIVSYSTKWEDRDGTIYYDSEAEGEILGEAIVDSFVPLEVTEDGCILFNFGMALYERI